MDSQSADAKGESITSAPVESTKDGDLNIQSELKRLMESDRSMMSDGGLSALQRMAKKIEDVQAAFNRLKEHVDADMPDLLHKNHFSTVESNGIPSFSAEVTPSNPYSRLMALERMGIVEEYTKIRNYVVAIVGIGGVGSVAAEMLTRCGIGKLILFDYDKVEMANMNRMFYLPHNVGQYKVDAAASTLFHITKEVKVVSKHLNVTTVDGFKEFLEILKYDGQNKGKVDLVLSCVDNYEARMAVNSACNELDISWFESGVSENAVSGHIQHIIPGNSACYACAPPLIVASSVDERTLKRDGVCAASLPTTMSVIAGILVQNALKKLLNFGEVSWYVGYDSLTDFFPKLKIKPNPSCDDKYCIIRQEEYKVKVANQKINELPVSNVVKEEILHEDNVYGISVEGSSDTNKEIPSHGDSLIPGVRHEYPAADSTPSDPAELVQDTEKSLEELMSEMKSL